jgi:SecD/SecF fusion protein
MWNSTTILIPSLKWKISLMVLLLIFSGMTVLPSFYKSVPDWWQKYLAPEGLRLGLDLQGGMHLVLKVDLEKAIENSLGLAAQDLKEALAEKQITVVRTDSGDAKKILFTLPNTGALTAVQEVVEGDFPNLDIEVQADEGSFPRIFLSLKDEAIKFINKTAVSQSLEIIRNRIDQFGVAEPTIVRQGKDEIIVQLPGVKDANRALALIGQTAQLEFKLVDDSPGADIKALIQQTIDAGQWSHDGKRESLNMALQGQLPAGQGPQGQTVAHGIGEQARHPPDGQIHHDTPRHGRQPQGHQTEGAAINSVGDLHQAPHQGHGHRQGSEHHRLRRPGGDRGGRLNA